MSSPNEPESYFAKGFRKCTKEPLVPIGCLFTVVMLLGGLRAFRRGEKGTQQYWMRGRVLAQGFTIVAMSGMALAGIQPHDRPKTMDEKMERIEKGSK
jgi:hypothetical protein